MKELFQEYLKKIDLMKTITGLVFLFIFSIFVWAIITKELPSSNREIAIHVLGIIEGVVVSMASYYYGSSKGSQQKQDIIENMKK